MSKYCFNCLNTLPSENSVVCPVCGYDNSGYIAEPHQLLPGTLINNRYLVGRVIGEGGFGITYVGKDTLLDLKVAIKEFYMSGYVNRNNTASTIISISTGQYQETFEKNREKFINEARVLARFSDHDGVVGIRDYFKANNTAYIVMDYLDGPTLKEYLDQKGKLSWDETFKIMRPVLTTLGEIHKSDVIHRDISPDNIKLVPDGKIKLLDFGAAREVSQKDIKSLSVILKPGYAPEEQYRSKGPQGPWTDIYALCATMYKCLTGTTPIDAMERMYDDNLVEPLDAGADVSPSLSKVLMKGLAVRQKDRYKTIDELMKDISYAEDHPLDTALIGPETVKEEGGSLADDLRTVMADDHTNTGISEELIGHTEDVQTERVKNETVSQDQQNDENESEEGPDDHTGPEVGTGGHKKWPLIALGVIALAAILLYLISNLDTKKPDAIPALLENMEVILNDETLTVPTTFAKLESLGWVPTDGEELNKTVEHGETYSGYIELTNGYGYLDAYFANPTQSTLMVRQCPIYRISLYHYLLNRNYMDKEINRCSLPGGFVLNVTKASDLAKMYGSKPKSTSTDKYIYMSEDQTKEYEFFNSSNDKAISGLNITNTNYENIIEVDTYSEYEPVYEDEELDEATGQFELTALDGEETVLEIKGCMLLSDFIKTGWKIEDMPAVLPSHGESSVYIRKDTLTTMVLTVSNPTNVARVTEYCFITGIDTQQLKREGKTDSLRFIIQFDNMKMMTGESVPKFIGWEEIGSSPYSTSYEKKSNDGNRTVYRVRTINDSNNNFDGFVVNFYSAAQQYFDR